MQAGCACLAAPLMLVFPLGCNGTRGPELIEVHGTVTMDGEPLPNATVRFLPQPDGEESVRPAIGITDDNGRYELEYSSTRSGTLPGKYVVKIRTYREEGEDDEGNETPSLPETVPGVYNANTTLTADVSAENREINFDLKSDAGPVVQPSTGEEADPEEMY